MCSVNAKAFLLSSSQFFPPPTLGCVPQISVIFKLFEFTWLCEGSAHPLVPVLMRRFYSRVRGRTSLGFQFLKNFKLRKLRANHLNTFGFLAS